MIKLKKRKWNSDEAGTETVDDLQSENTLRTEFLQVFARFFEEIQQAKTQRVKKESEGKKPLVFLSFYCWGNLPKVR